jgi:hypothetical protein
VPGPRLDKAHRRFSPLPVANRLLLLIKPNELPRRKRTGYQQGKCF